MTIQTEVIEYSQDGAVFEGRLAADDSISEPQPGVVICHAWGGLSDYELTAAHKLAELGYAAFCLDVYGKGIRGSGPEENAKLMQPLLEDRALLQSRLLRGLQVASEASAVDTGRLAAIGYCFGGLCVLDLARCGANVSGVVSFHGLFHPPGNTEGQPISAKVLALHGWDDGLAPPESVVGLASELTTAGADWQLHAYGHTLHAFTNPQAQNPEQGAQYSESADRRSWQAAVNFLAEL